MNAKFPTNLQGWKYITKELIGTFRTDLISFGFQELAAYSSELKRRKRSIISIIIKNIQDPFTELTCLQFSRLHIPNLIIEFIATIAQQIPRSIEIRITTFLQNWYLWQIFRKKSYYTYRRSAFCRDCPNFYIEIQKPFESLNIRNVVPLTRIPWISLNL